MSTHFILFLLQCDCVKLHMLIEHISLFIFLWEESPLILINNKDKAEDMFSSPREIRMF